MCGVAGIFAYSDATIGVGREELRAIRDRMASRGLDGSGEWYSEDGRVGLGHRRLSIIDLSDRASQPMMSADGEFVVVFNGEIYNFKALRDGLITRGALFHTTSDTEVLLHLYREKGEGMVHDLCGMFAFAIWDEVRRRLFLARDPYGIKPLYYADNGRTFRFASQVKALLAGGQIARTPDPAGWVGYYLFGSVPEPYTTYLEARALPAGSTLWVDRLGPGEVKRYFSIGAVYREAEACDAAPRGAELQERARHAFLGAVRRHLVADVPVGAFLSGGVDSGSLVGLMRDAGQNDIQTVTIAFDEFTGKHDNEAPLASRVAALYGTRHTTRTVSQQEFTEDLPRIVDAMDQPTIDGVNTWFVSKAAHELGLKVVISGTGGDELLGGYPSFRDIPRWVRLLAIPSRIPFAGEAFRQLVTTLAPGASPKAASVIKYGDSYAGAYLLRRGLFMPWELPRLMDPGLAREGLRRLKPLAHIRVALAQGPKAPFNRVATLEASLYMRDQLLRDSDWTSMAHGLELRTPLVDSELLRTIAPCLGTTPAGGKALLANSPSAPLPREIVQRRKSGFGTPIDRWLQDDWRVQAWRRVPALALRECHWAKRWAFQMAAFQGVTSVF